MLSRKAITTRVVIRFQSVLFTTIPLCPAVGSRLQQGSGVPLVSGCRPRLDGPKKFGALPDPDSP
jgi:hypothetical protein